ncbi:hypothetical protein GCM10012278_57410 [Nonomuraea glycinis]|uniref:DUF5753 domain-containing protein n=1 Tax=Nonomuraea glycinis TaxID=2047744 RepID=A0A918A8X8_9ACTN|nr:hypothetical protein GCM10012278_57410 [Nonomuraea glycinis]
MIPFAPASEIDRRVEIRMTRQKVLRCDSPLNRYSLTFDQLRAIALNPDNSVELISKVIGHL